MKFLIEVIDEQVERLERQENTVFSARLLTLLVKELGKYNPNVIRASVSVKELVPGQVVKG